jgi:hypothetical protein
MNRTAGAGGAEQREPLHPDAPVYGDARLLPGEDRCPEYVVAIRRASAVLQPDCPGLQSSKRRATELRPGASDHGDPGTAARNQSTR